MTTAQAIAAVPAESLALTLEVTRYLDQALRYLGTLSLSIVLTSCLSIRDGNHIDNDGLLDGAAWIDIC